MCKSFQYLEMQFMCEKVVLFCKQIAIKLLFNLLSRDKLQQCALQPTTSRADIFVPLSFNTFSPKLIVVVQQRGLDSEALTLNKLFEHHFWTQLNKKENCTNHLFRLKKKTVVDATCNSCSFGRKQRSPG